MPYNQARSLPGFRINRQVFTSGIGEFNRSVESEVQRRYQRIQARSPGESHYQRPIHIQGTKSFFLLHQHQSPGFQAGTQGIAAHLHGY